MFHYLIKSIMAKSDSFFGLRRGSTKTLTFSVLKGKQITKDRVEGGRNPRTPEQMVQRMCMATASAAYAQMKQIVDHSFEGITYGQTTMSEFIRVNADALRQNYIDGTPDKFSYNPYRDRLMYAGSYIMSRGTASPIEPYHFQADGGGAAADTIKVMAVIGGGSGAVKSADQLFATLGIAVGDMATLCVLWEDDTDASAHFFFVRLTALKSGTDALTAQNLAQYVKFESNVDLTTPTITDGTIELEASTPNYTGGAWAQCIIHSKKSNGKWLRSNAAIDVSRYQVRPDAADALATYPVGPAYVLNGGTIEE